MTDEPTGPLDGDVPETDPPDDGPDAGPPSGNGDPWSDPHGTPDATLGGYLRTHDRPPAFEGSDGQPYTVSPEVEQTGELPTPYEGYLVFPRWAATGLGVVGHVETPTLVVARTREEAEQSLGEISLVQLKELLDQAIRDGEEARS